MSRLLGRALRITCTAVTAFCSVSGAPPPLQAQVPGLDRVEELVKDGRVPEARLALDVWWATERLTAAPAGLERAMWLRARTTPRTEQAEFLFRRLMQEFPDGPYAEGARERLSLLAAARTWQPE